MVRLSVIERTRKAFAVFTVFVGALVGVALASGAPAAFRIISAAVAAGGATIAVVLWWLEHQAEQLQEVLYRERQIDERFARALELLGDQKLALGGIFLVEGVMRESPRHHTAVVELLVAYIRENAPWPSPNGAGDLLDGGKRRPSPNVQAALRVLGRRDECLDEPGTEIRLSDLDLRGASLRGGHFANARFRRTHLEGASLEGVHLEGAKLRDAHLAGANLGPDDEHNLDGAHLEGACLPGAILTEATLAGTIYDSNTIWPAGFDPEEAECHLAADKRTLIQRPGHTVRAPVPGATSSGRGDFPLKHD